MQEVLDVHSFLEFSSDSRKRKAWPQLFFGCNEQFSDLVTATVSKLESVGPSTQPHQHL